MDKVRSLPGLDITESSEYYDDIEVIQQGAVRKPMNLVAVLIWLISTFVSVVGVSAALFTVAWWIPIVVILGMLPLASKQMKLYELGWSMLIHKTPEARKLTYLQRVALRHEYAKEVRLYNLIPYISDEYKKHALKYTKAMRQVRNNQLLGVIPMNLLFLLVTAGVFIFTVSQVASGILTIGSVVLVIASLTQMRESLAGVSEYIGLMTDHLLWYKKYFKFLDSEPEIKVFKNADQIPNQPDICFKNVSFAYKDSDLVVKNLNITIPFGQKVAIVGENGAGKSTLVKLLLRFYDPSSGGIYIGSEQKPLENLDIEQWRAEFTAVFQDFAKFEWTILQNITLSKSSDQQKLESVSQLSGVNDFADQLSDGMNTQIGQAFNGIDLSGGQWQKLAMARAFYRKAKILVLDEPTAALDPRSEAEIYNQFASLAEGRTTIMITHRLGSVLMADRILVMKDGQIIEDGSHSDLLAKDGEYTELWNLQKSQYDQ